MCMARKQPIEEIESLEVESLDTVDKPISSANIHWIITSLSPVKKGRIRNFFDGTVDFLERKEAVELKYKKEEEATIWKCCWKTLLEHPKRYLYLAWN